MNPGDLRYSQTHEWVNVEGGKALVGLTDFAIGEIKDVVYIELPRVGAVVRVKSACGAIETVKAVFDLYVPVSGRVLSTNADLLAHPERVSAGPLGANWLMELEVDPVAVAAELATLMDAAAYSAYCAREGGH